MQPKQYTGTPEKAKEYLTALAEELSGTIHLVVARDPDALEFVIADIKDRKGHVLERIRVNLIGFGTPALSEEEL